MSLKACVLASGSSGNCVYVASEQTRILIDAGLSGRETLRRLELIEVDPAQVNAVCVTHEHDDHKASLGILHRRYGIELYANDGTIQAIERNGKQGDLRWNVFTTGHSFPVGDLDVRPFSVPHDSYEPVGFVVSNGEVRIGIVTDMGTPTELIREHLRHCRMIVIESNHDEQLLRDAVRPWSLKQRIAGRQGHLWNSQAGELLVEIADEHLRTVFLAHLSADCNRPDLALETVREALREGGHSHVDVKLTYADRVSDLIAIP